MAWKKVNKEELIESIETYPYPLVHDFYMDCHIGSKNVVLHSMHIVKIQFLLIHVAEANCIQLRKIMIY